MLGVMPNQPGYKLCYMRTFGSFKLVVLAANEAGICHDRAFDCQPCMAEMATPVLVVARNAYPHIPHHPNLKLPGMALIAVRTAVDVMLWCLIVREGSDLA